MSIQKSLGNGVQKEPQETQAATLEASSSCLQYFAQAFVLSHSSHSSLQLQNLQKGIQQEILLGLSSQAPLFQHIKHYSG